MGTTAPHIRPATPDDAEAIVPLAQLAGHGIPDFLWTQAAKPGQTATDVGILRIRGDGNFSYRNAQLAILDGQIVGLLIAYRLPESDAIDPNDFAPLLRPLIELEQCVPGSYYINILATDPAHQGQGIGARLIERANALALEQRCSIMSLQVFEQNADAVRFYAREGFELAEHRQAVPHACYPYTGRVLLMTRSVGTRS